MARRRSASEREQIAQLRRIIYIAVIVVVAALAVYYLFTGADPLGLFTVPEAEQEQVAPQAFEPAITVGGGGDWWHVYFTDPVNRNDPSSLAGTVEGELIALIDAAQSSIHVASFEFNLTPVAEALIAAKERGVEILWVTDDEYGIDADEEEGHGQFAMLEDADIEVRDDDRGALMHNKFWIFDGQTVWTGSTNVTVNGMFYNNNNVIVIRSPEVAEIYEREFDEMWDGEFGPTSSSTLARQTANLDGSTVRVLFAAEDEVASRLVPLVEGARSSVRFMAFSFTHDELGAAVLARAQAGVDVRGIMETRGSETEYSELPPLYCSGVPVRQDGNSRTFHHKVFVIDEQIVVTGSFNFSANADESNDENVIVIYNSDVAAQYLAEFERRWAEASSPDAAEIECP